MSKFFVLICITLCALKLSLADEVKADAEAVTSAPLPPLNLVESPEYIEDKEDKPNTVQIEKLQYEAIDDGRPLLEKRTIKEETGTGALYEAGEDLMISPESSITPSEEIIEDTEDLPPPPPPEALLESSSSSGESK